MAMNASNVAVRAFNHYAGGELIEDTGWKTSGFLYTGCNPNYNHNRILIVRFTLEKFAKTVSIPLTCASTNGTTESKLLCYGFGSNPDIDSSMVNVTGAAKAIGTFYFGSTYSTKTLVLSNVDAGTHYLYVWGQKVSDYSLTNVNAGETYSDGISYEELEGFAYVEDGTGQTPYLAYIDSGTSQGIYIGYVDTGTDWAILG